MFHCSIHIFCELISILLNSACESLRGWMHADCLLFLFFAVLSSITAVWKRMYASSHSHSSAIHYSTLAMGRHFLPHPQWTEHHITTVDYNSYRLAHFSCAVSWAFMSQTLLWTLFKRLVMQQRTLVYMAFKLFMHFTTVMCWKFCERCLQTEMPNFCLCNAWL